MENETCSNLYSWFEKCGIISDVRTHLRQNLINALQNKDIDIRRDNIPKSAKQYVYDLLIAEYLLNHNYAYTLSVFASEAPLLVNFHHKSGSVSNPVKSQEKLQMDYIVHALETLGVDPQSPRGQYIISQYVENDLPLLLCALKSLSVPFINTQTAIQEEKFVSNKQIQTDYSEQWYSINAAKLISARKKILHQKKLFETELKRREAILKQQAVVMDQQLQCLNSKLEEVQNIMHIITTKESELCHQKQCGQNLLQKEMELAHKEKTLLQEANRKFEEDLRKLQEKLNKLQLEIPENISSEKKTSEVQTDSTVDLEKNHLLEVLQKENKDLNNLIKEQQLSIEQLTQRAFQLSRQIEDINLLKPISNTGTPLKPTNAIVSETSSTEDILQDAKLRLRRLEEESLKADRYYYNFINTS